MIRNLQGLLRALLACPARKGCHMPSLWVSPEVWALATGPSRAGRLFRALLRWPSEFVVWSAEPDQVGDVEVKVLNRGPDVDEEGFWLHVVNVQVKSLQEFLPKFMAITGEVCASKVLDEHFTCRREILAVVLSGPATKVWDTDVWSHTCPLTGRRVWHETREGASRTEAWVVPAKCEVACVVTSCPEFARECEAMDVTVVLVASRDSLRRSGDLSL